MLKETEETLDFVVIIFIIGCISIGEGTGLLTPPDYAYNEVGLCSKSLAMGSSISLLLAKLLLDLHQRSSFGKTFLSILLFTNFSKKFFQLSI